MDDNEKLEATAHPLKNNSYPSFLGFPNRVGFSFPSNIAVHLKLFFPQKLVFPCCIRNGQKTINSAPYRNCCDPYFQHLDQLPIVLECKRWWCYHCIQQAVFQNGQKLITSCKKKKARYPLKRPLLPLSYCLGNLKLMATN